MLQVVVAYKNIIRYAQMRLGVSMQPSLPMQKN